MYRSGCRASADAVRGVAVDKRKAESCRAGGVLNAGIFGVRGVMIAYYRFCSVLYFGGGGCGGIVGVPVVRVGDYGVSGACFFV